MSGGGEQAATTVDTIIKLFRKREASLDQLLNYVPDDVLDGVLERVKTKQEMRQAKEAGGGKAAGSDALPAPLVSFKDILEYGGKEGFHLDAFAMRLLVFHNPKELQTLSSITLGDRFLQRCAVVGASGEQAVLTFELVLQDALEPRYRGINMAQKWFLRSVAGEPGCEEEPKGPNPRLSPDLVVLAQLQALKDSDPAGVYQFASQSNRKAMGPVARFAQTLQTPAYAPLLAHREVELLKSMQLNATAVLVVTGVTSSRPAAGSPGEWQKYVYVWGLSLQSGGDNDGCWMTDTVHSISTFLSREAP